MSRKVDGRITISRPHIPESSGEYINISIENKDSGRRILDGKISLENFSKALTGLGNIKTELTVYYPDDNEYNYCRYYLRGKQCIWGLRGICGDQPCKIREDLRG